MERIVCQVGKIENRSVLFPKIGIAQRLREENPPHTGPALGDDVHMLHPDVPRDWAGEQYTDGIPRGEFPGEDFFNANVCNRKGIEEGAFPVKQNADVSNGEDLPLEGRGVAYFKASSSVYKWASSEEKRGISPL